MKYYRRVLLLLYAGVHTQPPIVLYFAQGQMMFIAMDTISPTMALYGTNASRLNARID